MTIEQQRIALFLDLHRTCQSTKDMSAGTYSDNVEILGNSQNIFEIEL